MNISLTPKAPTKDGFYFWRRNEFDRVEFGKVIGGHFAGDTIASSIIRICFLYPDSLWSEEVTFNFSAKTS